MLAKLWIWLKSFFNPSAPVLMPEPLERVSVPLPIPKPPNASAPASPTGKYFFRIIKTPGALNSQFVSLTLQVAQMISDTEFIVLDKCMVRSGLPEHQFLRLAAESKSGSSEPIPEGYYKVGPVEWKGKVDDYTQSWGTGMGATWSDIIPQMSTQRSALGFHLDTSVAGTNGCVGFPSIETEKLYIAWRNHYPISWLNVNYGLSSVETKIFERKSAPSIPAPGGIIVDNFIKSPNYNEIREQKIDTIILHNTEGSVSSAIARFMNASEQVSAHYIIGRDGKVTQMVKELNVAWHSGEHKTNHRSLGIEIEAGSNSVGSGITPVQEAKLISVIKSLMHTYSIKPESIEPHRHVVSTSCPGSIWPTDHDLESWKAKNLV